MNLIVETDLGHDPDDFFALCYLIAAGVNIRTILISPGDPDQIAIARFLCKKTELNIPIGCSKPNRTKLSSGSIHHELLEKYKFPLESKADDLGINILPDIFNQYPDSELFVIGPVTSIGNYLKNNNIKISKATMQGGFFVSNPPLPQFEGKTWMPTFNLNGDRPAAISFLNANIERRQMVGKNVCHGILYTKEIFSKYYSKLPNNPAKELFAEATEMYFNKHSDKKFHDPTAACLHLHPEIASWKRGKTIKIESGWGTDLNPNGDYICSAIPDESKLWNHILNFN